MSYIVVVVYNNTLDICETFDTQQAALDTAIAYCNVNNLLEDIRFDPSAEGWLVFQDDKRFVAIMRRQARVQHMNYNEITKSSQYLNHILPDNVNMTSKSKDLLPNSSSSKVIENLADDPYADHLPFGFDCDDKPMRMKDASMIPSSVVPVYQLSDTQHWAIVEARVRHRPFICFHYDPNNKNYFQQELLEEIKNRSIVGDSFCTYELGILDDFHLENLKISSSEEEYEESSSSDEESDDED